MTRAASGSALALVAAFWFVGCAEVQAPAPTRSPVAERAWISPAATLTLPVRLPPLPVRTVAEAGVPATVSGQGSGQRTLSAWFLKHQWKYWWSYELRRAPLALTYRGSQIRVQAALAGFLHAQWDTLEGEISSEVEADAGVEADLTLGADWKLRVQARPFLEVRRAEVPIGIAWDGNFFGETISIAAPVREALQAPLDRVAADLVKRLDGYDFGPQIEGLWRDLAEPRPLGDGLWFQLRPEALTLGALQVEAEGLQVSLAVTIRPQLTDSRPGATRTPWRFGGAEASDQVRLPLGLGRPWATLRAEALAPGPMVLKPAGGGRWTVTDLQFWADGARVAVAVTGRLSPPWPGPEVDAVLWFTARPEWDPETRSLALTDRVWTPESRKELAEKAGYLNEALDLAAWEERLRWPLGPDLDRLAAEVPEALDGLSLGKNAVLTGRLGPPVVDDLGVEEGGLRLLVRFAGTLSLGGPASASTR